MKDKNLREEVDALVQARKDNPPKSALREQVDAIVQEGRNVGDIVGRISRNADAFNAALANKGYEKAKADTKKMLEESTLNADPYPTSEDVQMAELQSFMDDRANEAKMRGVQDYLDQTIGAWGTEKASDAAIDLVGVDAKITTPDALMRNFNNPYSVQTLRDIASQVTDTSFASLPADARAQAEKIADEYIVENPHTAYERDLYVNYFASQIYEDVFKRKINTDDKFFADAYEAMTGKSYKSYKREVDKDAVRKLQGMKRELEAMNETLKKKRDENRTHVGQSRAAFSSAWNDLRSAFGGNIESIENLIDEIDNVIEGSFTSGFDKGFDFDRMATVGMSGIFTEAEMAEALAKARKGQPLTEEEENYVRIHQYAQELNELKHVREKYAEQLYDTFLGYNLNSIAEGIGTTVEMAPAFAGAMKLTRGIGAFAKIGGMAALKSALEAGGTELFKYGVKTVGKLGYNYGLAKARGLVVAPIMPSTYNTYLESLNSAYSFDEEGNLTYTPVNERQEYLGAIFSTGNEVSSEYLGIGIGSIVGWGARGLGRMVANTRLAGVATSAGKKVRKHLPKLTPQAKVAMRTFGVQADPVSETLSEALGDIMTSYEQSMIGMDVDKSEYGTMDYWMTLMGVSLAYGGTIATMGAVKSYRDVKKAVKAREDILGGVTNRNLYNTLVAISTSDDVVLASSALADFDWKGNYGNAVADMEADMKRANAYVAADLNVKILESAVEEESRLDRFRSTIEGVRSIVYQGKAGEYSDIIREAEMDGKKVYIINGYEANTNQYIVVDATTGEKTSVDKSKVTVTRELDVDTYIQEAYANTFSLEAEKQRVADVKAKALQLDNPTEKDVARVASTLGIALPKVGNTVMLANGNMGAVMEVLSPTEYAVQDPSGATYKVHFTDILSTDKLTATAQGALARGEVAAPIAPVEETTQPTEVAETTTEVAETTAPDENGITIGAEVIVDGRVGKVRARTQDGKYAVAFETESGNYEDTEVEFFTGEELASLMGIAPMPTTEAPKTPETTTEVATTEDGSVDIETMSAEDAAKALIQRAGTIEEAIAQVKQVIETVTEERKKAAKAEKKTSLNDIGKKSAELQALDTRLEFYGEVLGVLEAMLAEKQKQNMTEAQNIAEEAGVAPKTTEAVDTTTEENKPVERPTSGLIRNGAEMKFTDNVIKMVDFIAKRLGITVEFADGIKNEAGQPINGDIKGKHVRISTSGTKGIKFIMGHEFFHRMKDLVDEQTYADFVNSIKEYAGEKVWDATMAHQRNVYRNHNARVAKEAMAKMTIEDVAKIAARLNINIEGLSLEDAKTAVAKGAAMGKEQGVAEVDAIFPTMLSYDDALMVEECAADVAGGLVTNTKTFAKYVEDNSSNIALVRGIRKAIRAMREFFDSFGYTDQHRKLNALEKSLANVLNEAAKNEAKATTEGKTKNSLIGEVGATALDMAEEATIRMDNLAIARQMEERGDSALDIRRATGWERGADGLWRYEIEDAEVSLYDGNEAAIRKKIEVAEEEEKDFMQQSKADTKELRERTNTYLAEMREKYGVAEGEETDAMTEEEIAHLQSLTGKEIAFEDYKERRRSELYNRRMALEAQLGYVKVKNTDSDAMIQTTRLGHILQGKNADALFTAYPSLRDMEVQFVTDIRDGAFAAYATKGGYKRIELNAKKTPVDMLTYYLMHEVQHAIQDVEGFAGGGNLSSLQNNGEATAKEAYDYYRKIAGEVEARNVSARLNMSAEERLNTLLSETEDVAREDQIFLRDGVEMAMAEQQEAMYSLSEETIKIFDAAKSKFGTTYDMREAGYILPDGSMLDFSGRHQVEGDASFLNGDRTVDHREISDIAYDAEDNETGIKTDLGDFLDRGAIRIDSNAGAINLNVAPTKAQKDRLKRLIERNDGYVYVDFGKGWDTEHYAEYEAARASRVLGDIDRYFDEGIKPTGNVRFSLQDIANDVREYDYTNGTELYDWLDFVESGRIAKNKTQFHIANTGEILNGHGIKGKINVTRKAINAKRHTDNDDHKLGVSGWAFLVATINNPMVITRYNNEPNSYRIYTIAEINGKNICAGVDVNATNGVEITKITTAFGRDITKIESSSKEKEIYRNENAAEQISGSDNSHLYARLLSKSKDTTSIAENQTNEQNFSLITPEMDADYLSAVERGDMATAQQMVMEAAKLAMPNTKVVDENGNPKVVYHQTNHSVYINRETGQNWDELDWRERMEWDERDDWDEYWEEQDFNTFSRVNARTTQELDGFFFAPEYDEYHEYGERTIEAFLNIENPASFGDYNIDSSKTNAGRDERIRLQNEGYDGVINEEDGAIWEYIAFNPNQIKSADPVTYDDNGNVIPLSERFNPKKEDIRYALSQEDIDNALSNFRLTKDNANDFCYALMQMLTGKAYFDYAIVGDMEIRIKDHTPDWDNFLDWDTDEAKHPKILNVTVGDYNNTDYRRNKRDYEEFVEKHPETIAVDVEIEDGAYLEDAVDKIHSALKEKGIDFETTPSYEWVETYSEEKNDLSNLKYSRKFSLQSEEDILFEKKTAFLTGLVRDYNIPLPTFFTQTTEEFVRMAQDYLYLTDDEVEANRAEIERKVGAYVPEDEIILINGGAIRGKEQMSGCVRHEFGHDITKKHLWGEVQQTVQALGEDAIKRAHHEFLRGYDYKKIGPEGVVNEIVSYLVETPTIQEINAIFEGRLEVDDYISKLQGIIENRDDLKEKEVYIATLPLAKKNIELQKQQYGAEKENIIVIPRADSSGRGNSISKGGSTPTHSKGISGTQARSAAHIRRGEGTDAQEITRYHLPDPDPSDVFFDEIPIFDEQGNEVDITTLTSEEAKEILDGKVRQMLEAEYDHAVVAIRREAEEARQAVKEAYRAEKEKRRKGAKAARTNAARIDEIFGDTPFESLPYEVQALILIATGQAKIYWGDKGNKRGLASELGLTGSTGDRHAYRNIWGGAKKSFDEVVHEWWESLGGYESGVDTQNLRNALISALQSVQSSKDAMQEIVNKYDDLATDRDNALAEVDRNEEKELREAKTAYEQHLANFELAEGEERTAYYDRAAQFFGNQSLSRVDDILEDLTNELERSKRKIERLKAEKKDVYTPLAESIQHAKDTVLRALERLRMFAGMEEVDLNDVARLINLVKASRSQRQIENLGAQATALVQRVSIKKAKTNLMRLLSLKLSNTDIIHKMLKEPDTWTKGERDAILKHLWKVSRNGLRVSKAVHKDTKEIVDELKSLVDAFRKSELKSLNDAQKAKIIEAKLAEVEKELHPEVVYDDEGNVQDNANLPTDFNAENKHLAKFFFKSYLEMLAKEMEYHNAAAELREKIDNKEKTDGANAAMVVARENYLNALNQFNSSLESLILEGKDKLRDWNAQKEKHEIEIRSMGIRAIGGKKASGQGKASSKMARARATLNISVNAPYWTFETVLEKIDHNSPYKKGKLYTYFMDKWTDANDDLINRYAAHMEEIAEVMRKCFPDDAKNILKLKRNPYALYQYIMRKAESTPIGTLTYKEMGEDGKMRDAQIVLNVANAMYVIAMWRQPRYQEAMQEKHGITQSDIDALMANIASVNAGFLDFMDWVNETFLPSTRLEYDVVYRKMNGGSMPKEINYFPARVAGHKEVDLANIDNGALPTTPSALKDRMSAHIMPQLGMDYFKVLESHIQDMDNWAAYAELTADLNVLLSSDEFRRRCNDYMGGLGGDGGGKGSLYDLFKQTSLIATGMYRGDAGMQQLLGHIQKAWATSNIAFRYWTAVKQISSVTTGMFDNLRFYKHLGIAATGVGIYHEIKNAMEISPSLRYRWKSGAAGMEALARETQREDGYTVQRGAYEKGKDFIGDAIKTLVRAGMTPNAAVDLLACSIIVNSVYETEIARLTGGKREATEEEKRAAVRKAERAFNTTQQSSEGAYLAPVQATPAWGVLTTYMNASFALHRKRMGGIKELWKLATSKQYRRYLKDEFGVDAAKISAKDAFKDILSGVAGELSFAMMGWGLMKVMTVINGWLNEDDDDEDVAAAKQEFFDSWWQSLLNGYLGGSVVSSWINGFDTSLTPAYDELVEDVKTLFDDKGSAMWEVAMMFSKYYIGIDLESWYKSAAAIENMYEDDERAGAVLMFLNAPDRYVKAFVGDRREGETLDEYTTRVGRTYALLEEIKFDEKGKPVGEGVYENFVPKSRYNDLDKAFEEEYREDMLKKYGGDTGYVDYTMADLRHKQICGLLDWNPDATPSEKMVQTDMQDELEYYQKRVAKAVRKRKNWVGDDEGYYDLLMDEQEAKNDLINNYYEYIKQAGLGAY